LGVGQGKRAPHHKQDKQRTYNIMLRCVC
jgi:hypothetical protein